jgi:hypothetical protein
MKSKSKQSRRMSMSVDTTLNIEKQLRQGNSSFRPLSASPRLVANAINSQSYGAEDALEVATERVLQDLLVSLNRIIFKAKAVETSHDLMTITEQIKVRSQEIYESDLTKTISKLEHMQGSQNKNHKLSALVQLGGRYLQDIERLIFTTTKQELDAKTADLFSLREFSKQNDNKLRQEIVSKDQLIARLQNENERLLNEKQECERNYITLQKEFDGAILRNAQVNQQMVEFRLRGLDLKSEVNRRAKKVLKSVESRLGFLPQDIVRNISYLSILKAPGDPEYDKVRVLSLAQTQSSKFQQQADIKRSKGKSSKSINDAIEQAFQNHQRDFYSSAGLETEVLNSSRSNKNVVYSPNNIRELNYNRTQDFMDQVDGADTLQYDNHNIESYNSSDDESSGSNANGDKQ